MAVTIFGNIQHRRGIKSDLPVKLEEGELGFCVDTRELFIGNSEALGGGNTQVFTDAINIAQATSYQFLSATQVPSRTGITQNQPVIRSLQNQLDDAWVNVRAFGATGDGITNDHAAIQRAITDLYTKSLTTSESVNQARKTIWFPSGTYLIDQPLKLYPGMQLQGENRAHTQIVLVNPTQPQPCVIQLTDSLGQTGVNLGTNGAIMPSHIQCVNLMFESQHAACVILLERPSHIYFHTCAFVGVWQPGDPVVPGSETTGILLQSLGPQTIKAHVQVHACEFRNLEWALYCTDPVHVISLHACDVHEVHLGMFLEGVTGARYVKVQNCVFDQITEQAIKILDTSHITSLNNTFLDVNSSAESIYWGVGTQSCSSMSDLFENVPGVVNLGFQNLIVDAQQNNLAQLQLQFDQTIRSIRNSSGPTVTMLTTDDIIQVDCSASIVAVSLVTVATTGKTVTIKDAEGNSLANPITITSSVTTIDGQPSFVLNTNHGSVTLIYSGSEWKVI